MKTNKINQAIADIVAYNTLPIQIDYRMPWRIKADKAEKYLEEYTTQKEYDEAMKQITRQIDSYYEPDSNGMSAAAYNNMF